MRTKSLSARVETAAVATDCLVALFSVSKSTLRGRLGSGARGGSCASSGSTRTRSRNSGDGGSREAFDPEAGPQRPRIETWEGAAVVIVAVAAMREAFGPGADAGQRGGSVYEQWPSVGLRVPKCSVTGQPVVMSWHEEKKGKKQRRGQGHGGQRERRKGQIQEDLNPMLL